MNEYILQSHRAHLSGLHNLARPLATYSLGEIIAEKGRPVVKEQEIPVELQVTLEELEAILGDQDGPMAD